MPTLLSLFLPGKYGPPIALKPLELEAPKCQWSEQSNLQTLILNTVVQGCTDLLITRYLFLLPKANSVHLVNIVSDESHGIHCSHFLVLVTGVRSPCRINIIRSKSMLCFQLQYILRKRCIIFSILRCQNKTFDYLKVNNLPTELRYLSYELTKRQLLELNSLLGSKLKFFHACKWDIFDVCSVKSQSKFLNHINRCKMLHCRSLYGEYVLGYYRYLQNFRLIPKPFDLKQVLEILQVRINHLLKHE